MAHYVAKQIILYRVVVKLLSPCLFLKVDKPLRNESLQIQLPLEFNSFLFHSCHSIDSLTLLCKRLFAVSLCPPAQTSGNGRVREDKIAVYFITFCSL